MIARAADRSVFVAARFTSSGFVWLRISQIARRSSGERCEGFFVLFVLFLVLVLSRFLHCFFLVASVRVREYLPQAAGDVVLHLGGEAVEWAGGEIR